MVLIKTAEKTKARRAAMAAAVGSTVEWYDFALYGAAASLIFNKHFFVGDDPTTGLLLSFATFAVGYLARPLGGVIFGHLGDKVGRKPVMIFCLTLMGVCTALIGLLPDYQSIGLSAPLILVALRIMQGLGAGAEYAGAVVMSTESSPPTSRGFYASWSGSGVWLGSAIGLIVMQLTLWATGDKFDSWGWRLPFLFSLIMLGVSLYIRRQVSETDDFKEIDIKNEKTKIPLVSLFKTEKRRLLIGLCSNFMLSGFSYIPQVWALSYLTNNLGMAAMIALGINAIVLISGSVFMPIMGRIGDVIGRRRLFLWGAAFGGIWTIPMFLLIETRHPVLATIGLAVCFFGSVAACYASQAAFLTELFPPQTRYSAVAFSREVSGAILGGLTPLIATAIISATGHWAGIAIFMIANAAVAFIAVWYSKRFRNDAEQWKIDPTQSTTEKASVVI